MPIVLQSPTAYAGSATLSEIAEVSRSAADVYALYAARVTADGGVITDATFTLARITDAIAHGYFYRSSMGASARMGVKLSGSNIVKLYNVCGTVDGVVSGGGLIEKDTVHSAWATAKFDSGVNDAITFTGLKVNRLTNGALGFAVSSSPHASNSNVLFALFTVGGQTWNLGEGNPSLIVNGVTLISTGILSPDNGSSGILVEQNGTGGTLSSYIEGVPRLMGTQPFTNLAAGAAADYVIKVNIATAWMNEWWHMDAATRDTFGNLNLDMANRY